MKKPKPSSHKPSVTSPKPAWQLRRTQTIEPAPPTVVDEASLLADLRALVQSARQRVATVANATQTLLYWHVGRRLLKENLQNSRAAYGKRILATVSRELALEFGRGFNYASVNRMIQFFQLFPDKAIVSTLSAQLSWSHFLALLPIEDPLARDFYAELCRIEHWDVRTLRQKIGGMLFQRTALSRNAKAVISLERAPGDESPIGLILCAAADAEQVELLQLDAKSIRVSEYLTELPPLKLLQTRLHQAIEHAREQTARRQPTQEGQP